MPRKQQPQHPKPLPIEEDDYRPFGEEDGNPIQARRKGMIYEGNGWPDSLTSPGFARLWLSNLRAGVLKHKASQPASLTSAEGNLSDSHICEKTLIAIDALLASVEDDKTLGLACDLAIQVFMFTALQGLNEVYAHGEKMKKGQSLGAKAKKAKNNAEEARAHQALGAFKEANSVAFSTGNPNSLAKEMLGERAERDLPGAIKNMKKNTLRGYADSFMQKKSAHK